MKHTARASYWLASAERPPYADAQSPTYYRMTSWRGEESFGYSTLIGYRRHVSAIRAYLREDGGRIITEYQHVPNGNRVIIYRPGYERGPHAAPHAVVIEACKIEGE